MVAKKPARASQARTSSPATSSAVQSWVLLNYRIPREPSTPRIAVWRRLKSLGVAQVGDGLVALPATPKTIEHFEWVAESVVEADGEAMVWQASTARGDSDALAARMQAECDADYDELTAEVLADPTEDRRSIARWRRQLRAIERRDWFQSPQRDAARLAIVDAVAMADAARAEST